MPGSGNVGRFQYTGQAWLPDLGMYYYKARIYSAKLGRFLQTDPIGYKDQMDLYAYVANDPVDGRDPSGKECNAVKCTADTFDRARATVDVKADPATSTAVYAHNRDYQKATKKGGEPTGVAKTVGGFIFVTPTGSKGGSTDSGYTAIFNLSGATAGVHGHLTGAVTDDPDSNHGYGDTDSITQGKPMYTIEGDRMGVHDAPGGQLTFTMTNGKINPAEQTEMQGNLRV